VIIAPIWTIIRTMCPDYKIEYVIKDKGGFQLQSSVLFVETNTHI